MLADFIKKDPQTYTVLGVAMRAHLELCRRLVEYKRLVFEPGENLRKSC